MVCRLVCVGLVAFLGTCVLVVAPDPETSEPPSDTALPTVVIDPGHGGKDEGAKSRGLKEKDVTLQLALALEAKLKERSFPVTLTRRTDEFVSLAERVEIANQIQSRNGPPLFISIHLNVDGQSATDGVETFYANQKNAPPDWGWFGFFNTSFEPADPGDVLAGFIQAAMVENLETRNRGIKARSLYVVRNTRCPAVLVEVGFLSNPVENHLLRQDFYRQRIASAIAEGIFQTLPLSVREQLTLNEAKPNPIQPVP